MNALGMAPFGGCMNVVAFHSQAPPMPGSLTTENLSIAALISAVLAGLGLLLKWRGAGYSELHKPCETLQREIVALHERINGANQAIRTAEERAAAAEKRAANADAGRIAVERRMANIEA